MIFTSSWNRRIRAKLPAKQLPTGAADAAAVRDDAALVSELTQVLTDRTFRRRGSRAALLPAPSRVGEDRREAEAAFADVRVSRPRALTDEDLAEAVDRFERLEREVSGARLAVQAVADALALEIGRRLSDGGR